MRRMMKLIHQLIAPKHSKKLYKKLKKLTAQRINIVRATARDEYDNMYDVTPPRLPNNLLLHISRMHIIAPSHLQHRKRVQQSCVVKQHVRRVKYIGGVDLIVVRQLW